jgi:hypothetical protein
MHLISSQTSVTQISPLFVFYYERHGTTSRRTYNYDSIPDQLTDDGIVDSCTSGGLEERAGAVEGDLATFNGGQLDAVPDGVHERREPRGGLADARVVEAHDLAAARRITGVLVLAVVPVVVPERPPAAVTVFVTVVVIVAVPELKVLLVSSSIVELLPRQPRAPRSRD